MTFYRPLSFLVLIVMFSLSTFYFLEEQDSIARIMIFFTIYAYLSVFFILKTIYYLKYKATFNELFFVVGLPLIPPILVSLGQITLVNELYFSNLLAATITVGNQPKDFSLSFASILALPYFFFSIYLLLRTFIRYEFIRWQAHSKGGPPGTLVGLMLSIPIGILYFVLSVIYGDLLIGFFGFIYSLIGVLGFLE